MPVLERIGTKLYGAYTVPVDLLNSDMVCCSAGAGEDISFEIGLIHRFGMTIHLFDPTPKAVRHVEKIFEGVKNNTPVHTTPYNMAYDISCEELGKLNFHPYGLWKARGKKLFYPPEREEWASYSICRGNGKPIELECIRLRDALDMMGSKRVDILKLDIEGCEKDVIESMVTDDIWPPIFCLELDDRKDETLEILYSKGYELLDRFGKTEKFTLMLKGHPV